MKFYEIPYETLALSLASDFRVGCTPLLNPDIVSKVAMSQEHLRQLPPVSEVLGAPELGDLLAEQGQPVVVEWIREALEFQRTKLTASQTIPTRSLLLPEIIQTVLERERIEAALAFGPVINATGVVLHTSLGRAPLADSAVEAMVAAASACNLEVELASGDRRERGYQLQSAWSSLTGAEASLVVNNNAAATLLALRALCAGREVLISRGQLIEIGGAFRLPDVFAESGAVLREVGTTNRTHLSDYRQAMTPATSAILRVHPSNYRVVGFAETPESPELCALAHEHGLIYIDDIGSGCLVETQALGLPPEPTFQSSLAADSDLVLGSGDKLLGGPQCGILLGRANLLEQLRHHPLARAVRIDKLTLAALSATLAIYRRKAELAEIPVLAMLSAKLGTLRERAMQIVQYVPVQPESEIRVVEDSAPVGGGSLPGAELPTVVLELHHPHWSPDEVSQRLRLGTPRLFPTVRRNRVCIDLRSLPPCDDTYVVNALRNLFSTPDTCRRFDLHKRRTGELGGSQTA